jgi:DNA polymerase-3 subunit delta
MKEEFGGNDHAIAKAGGMHPFVVKKSLQQLRNFPLGKLKKTYQKLADLDFEAKTGKIDIKTALDKFIVEL